MSRDACADAQKDVNSVVVRFRGVGWRQDSEIDDPFAFSEGEEDEVEGNADEEEGDEEEVDEDDLEDDFVKAIDVEDQDEKEQTADETAGTVINASADLHWILSWKWRIMALALVKRRQLEQVRSASRVCAPGEHILTGACAPNVCMQSTFLVGLPLFIW